MPDSSPFIAFLLPVKMLKKTEFSCFGGVRRPLNICQFGRSNWKGKKEETELAENSRQNRRVDGNSGRAKGAYKEARDEVMLSFTMRKLVRCSLAPPRCVRVVYYPSGGITEARMIRS
jgi:hypothetical protein